MMSDGLSGMHIRWALLLVLVLSGCGFPLDENWSGELTDCTGTAANPTGASTVVLFLEGPVTPAPFGSWGYEYGDGTWLLTSLQDSAYLGPRLTFTAEFDTTYGPVVTSSTYHVELMRFPDHFAGTVRAEGGNGTLTCNVTLRPRF